VARLASEAVRVEMSSSELFLDIDTPADYEKYLRHTGLR
jgi:hypothetical protein